jgi:5-deoxy-glucuronate isomerase
LSVGAAGSQRIDGWQHTGIKVAQVKQGQQLDLMKAAEERLIIPLEGGPYTVAVDGGDICTLRGRKNVFAGATDVLYLTTGQAARITAGSNGKIAVATAPATNVKPNRLITADETPIEVRGAGAVTRQIRNFGAEGDLDADKYIVCEVLTPAGNWSSYPAHKHDEITATENSLEEIYYFEMQGENGRKVDDPVGYACVTTADEKRPIEIEQEVRSGDLIIIPFGWHGPCMTPPGYDMYYLNIMAGPGARDWAVTVQPKDAWVNDELAKQQPDPRLA